MSYSFQQGLMTFLLKTSKDYFVSFQDVERTNILLKKANVYDNLDEILADSLCKILNVDAVIKSHYTYEKTKSEGAAMVNTVLWGSSGRTGTGSIVLQINNGLDGKMIWRYYNIMFEQSNFNANNMMERMMKKISRNFPYTK
ncbi:MAG: hypothetical protein IPK03_01415 [Bacteroidetes bacterium]|nr:hypothetical protein [Bacteroidota bacterium]